MLSKLVTQWKADSTVLRCNVIIGYIITIAIIESLLNIGDNIIIEQNCSNVGCIALITVGLRHNELLPIIIDACCARITISNLKLVT